MLIKLLPLSEASALHPFMLSTCLTLLHPLSCHCLFFLQDLASFDLPEILKAACAARDCQ
jgi:hypothetical protein